MKKRVQIPDFLNENICDHLRYSMYVQVDDTIWRVILSELYIKLHDKLNNTLINETWDYIKMGPKI